MSKSFEEYLGEIHLEENPMLLDDDIPEAFDYWLSTLGYEDTMQYWRIYSSNNPVCPFCTDILQLKELHWSCPTCELIGLTQAQQ